MTDITSNPMSAPTLTVAKLPDAIEKAGGTGAKCSIACNLPHGFTIHHAGAKLTLAGANHPKAIVTSLAVSGRWGITHNVPEEWFDDWVATHNVDAVRNGHIVKNTKAKIESHAEALGDGVKTGVDQIDPEAKGFKEAEGVETRSEED